MNCSNSLLNFFRKLDYGTCKVSTNFGYVSICNGEYLSDFVIIPTWLVTFWHIILHYG